MNVSIIIDNLCSVIQNILVGNIKVFHSKISDDWIKCQIHLPGTNTVITHWYLINRGKNAADEIHPVDEHLENPSSDEELEEDGHGLYVNVFSENLVEVLVEESQETLTVLKESQESERGNLAKGSVGIKNEEQNKGLVDSEIGILSGRDEDKTAIIERNSSLTKVNSDRESTLSEGKEKVISEKKKSFKCGYCVKTLCSKWYREMREKISNGEYFFTCDECKNSFVYMSLSDVYKQFPISKTSFACNQCRKTFIQQTDLIKHQKIHSNEKPFHCEICKKSFNWYNSLIEHRRIHTGEKPFVCEYCGKSFHRKKLLSNHKQEHVDEEYD